MSRFVREKFLKPRPEAGGPAKLLSLCALTLATGKRSPIDRTKAAHKRWTNGKKLGI